MWFYIFLFLFGLTLGSFINAFNYRLKTGQNVWRGRSACPSCRHVLIWRDLIPVLSFLSLKGRCRYCHQPIGWHYPLTEISAAILLVLIWFFTMNNTWAIFYSIVFLILLAVACFDLKYLLIPDKLLLACLVISLVFLSWQDIINNSSLLLSGLGAGLSASLFLGLIYLFSKGKAMGLGDVKLVFIIGLIVGWPNVLPSVFLSFLIGAIIGIALVLLKKKGMKEAVPFGPFLFLGGLISAVWGTQLINWYLSFLIK